MLAFTVLCLATGASGKEGEQSQTGETSAAQPHAVGKPVTTTTIRRCPDGYELVIRADGRRGCAKDILPAND
jgi:hypothetical protein